ncbi:MerR family transcriptional regulator [Notoacmeibacter ruber]|uniref:MerR family DNA-binding transcriptional regulator n=1 Tax=Notoacmeibacter ruber TaxID=2670375 RepID=A0A3L7J9I9_9HYPH|nr:MerR family DNA-binding transcriptional regulator [Notoacmeibacter ruber]RLQ87170.1 MerR family DNA-binding transcriptional regulator [Notoacmeibacter ruber]
MKSNAALSVNEQGGTQEGERSAQYMRIGEVAKELDVTLRALRFYEDKGLVFPKRVGTTRLYDRRAVTRLKLILLGRRVGFSLREVKQMMDLYEPDGSNYRQMKVVLEKGGRQLSRLEKQREELDGAIGELQQALNAVRTSLEKSDVN